MLFQCKNIQCLKFNGFLFSKSDKTDLLHNYLFTCCRKKMQPSTMTAAIA